MYKRQAFISIRPVAVLSDDIRSVVDTNGNQGRNPAGRDELRQRLVDVHFFVEVGGAGVEGAVAVEDIEDRVFHRGIRRVVVAGWKPHAQVASVVERSADDWKDFKVASHGGLTGFFLSQDADRCEGEQ